MRIGIDLDNTIIEYDSLFRQLACEEGLLSGEGAISKTEIRDLLRRRGRQGEIAWQRLQAAAYGEQLHRARFFAEAETTLRELLARGFDVFIVSHKTRFAAQGGVDLRSAAMNWLRSSGILDAGLREGSIYFGETRAEKIAQIARLDLSVFIDDLPEVLLDPDFPGHVEKWLFDPQAVHEGVSCAKYRSWVAMRAALYAKA